MKIRIVFIAAIALSLFSCKSASEPSDEILSSLGFIPVSTDLETPEIFFTDVEGRQRTLSEFEGSIVLVNFWASWCPPCRAEMPSMGTLFNKLKGSDFEMVAINVGENENLVDSFVEEFDIVFPVYYDPQAEAAGIFGISALPTTIILDRSGDVRAAVTGALEWDSQEVIDMFADWSR